MFFGGFWKFLAWFRTSGMLWDVPGDNFTKRYLFGAAITFQRTKKSNQPMVKRRNDPDLGERQGCWDVKRFEGCLGPITSLA